MVNLPARSQARGIARLMKREGREGPSLMSDAL